MSVAAETPEQQADLNAILYETVTAWPQGVETTLGGLDLPDLLAYDTLRVFGRLFKAQAEENEVDGDDRTP